MLSAVWPARTTSPCDRFYGTERSLPSAAPKKATPAEQKEQHEDQDDQLRTCLQINFYDPDARLIHLTPEFAVPGPSHPLTCPANGVPPRSGWLVRRSDLPKSLFPANSILSRFARMAAWSQADQSDRLKSTRCSLTRPRCSGSSRPSCKKPAKNGKLQKSICPWKPTNPSPTRPRRFYRKIVAQSKREYILR